MTQSGRKLPCQNSPIGYLIQSWLSNGRRRLCSDQTTLGLVLALLVALPAMAQDFEKGAAAYKRGDYAAALKELRPLALQGLAKAQNRLGFMYDKGQGVRKKYGKAVKWYRKAAEQGLAMAQNNLGYIYADGGGRRRNFVLGHMWWSLAAAKGERRAVNSLPILERYMTPAQIAEAQKLAREWRTKHMKK